MLITTTKNLLERMVVVLESKKRVTLERTHIDMMVLRGKRNFPQQSTQSPIYLIRNRHLNPKITYTSCILE